MFSFHTCIAHCNGHGLWDGHECQCESGWTGSECGSKYWVSILLRNICVIQHVYSFSFILLHNSIFFTCLFFSEGFTTFVTLLIVL